MRSIWLDGERSRTVDTVSLGAGRYRVTIDEATFELDVELVGEGRLRLVCDQGEVLAIVTPAEARRFVRLGRVDFVLERTASARASRGAATQNRLESPMPGVVTRVLVAVGEQVKKGQPLLAIEAMKMEHSIRAPRDGTVVALRAKPGEMVNGGVALVEMDGDERGS